jgi:hypothetical protein
VTGPLPLDQPDLVRRLRDALASAQFTADKIGDALGTGDEIVSRASDIPVQLRHLEQHATSARSCARSSSLSTFP